MCDSLIRLWKINIENSANAVCSMYGQEVVNSVFRRYKAQSIDTLSPCYYSEVFADLEQIANDN